MSPFQIRLWRSKADEIFWGSARGASKTFGCVGLLMRRAQSLNDYQAVIFRKRFKDFRGTIYPIVHQWLKIFDDKGFRFIESQDPRIVHDKTKSVINISAAETVDDTEKFQGASIHNLLVDEAQTILPEVLGRATAIVRGAAGGYRRQIYWIANPNGAGHGWLKKRFVEPARLIHPEGNVVDKKTRKYETWKHPVTGEKFEVKGHWQFDHEIDVAGEIFKKKFEVFLSKTWMNPVLDYREYTAQLSSGLKDNEVLRKQWIDNDWDTLSGEFFPGVSNAVKSFEVEPQDRILCGIDHGQVKTAAVWVAVDHLGRYKVFDAKIYHHMDIPDKVRKIKEAHKAELYIIDPAARMRLEGSGVRTLRTLYQMAGLTNLVYCKSNDRHSGWEACRTGFADGTLLLHPDCRTAIDSFSNLQTKENDSEDCDKNDGREFMDDGDHAADAVRYVRVNGFDRGESQEEMETRQQADMDAELMEAIFGPKRVR